MKVDNHRFKAEPPNDVSCTECPFADAYGYVEPGTRLAELCSNWSTNNLYFCPTKEDYAEACIAADLAQACTDDKE